MAASNLKSEFLKAASDGDLTRLNFLGLEIGSESDGVLPKVVDAEGYNALHLAAKFGKKQMCKFLIEDFEFDINSRARKGNTPLIAAIEAREHTTAVYLAENGADIGCEDNEGNTALHSAARTGQTEMVRLLLSKGAKVVYDLNTTKGLTPLHFACLGGEKEAVKLLLDHGADPNVTLGLHYTPLTMAAKSLECMELLLEAKADPNLRSAGKTPLTMAACKGDTRIIKRLLEAGADPDVVDCFKVMTPLEHAAWNGKVDAVRILLPVTSRIRNISEWTVDGVIEHVHSAEAVVQMISKREVLSLTSKDKGRKAFDRTDYIEAVHWYTEAHITYPPDSLVLSNRSLCWAKLNRGRDALRDAKDCLFYAPGWKMAHYREGAARMLLQQYSKAVKAFSKALELDPENEEIIKAHREAVEAELAARMSGLAVVS